ncbi:MvdC/MvdD family ATP grasp protein [Caulobacter hibisci]|uniref:Alpha-L-glutamate ligase n=1 Tax=Caulobacter hibisci TaxID=2035993 RepID=A0ABS0T1V2_9CAUL|nr:hypothetical protein [Caulobacter hibisci]MBI1685853.1 alpha-L-glutamate ligase [Caulobacter hibisci]
MTAGAILIVSHAGDQHTQAVLDRLGKAGAEPILFDTARFPGEIRLGIAHHNGSGSSLSAVIDGVERDLSAVRSAWWRRPLPYGLDEAMTDPDDRNFAFGECQAAINGLWSCLDATWMNDPIRDEAAARKTWQLKLAAAMGLRAPRTLITNDPDRAREFIAAEGDRGVIYKAFSATDRAWRETRLLRPEEQDQLDAVRHAPLIFQEHIRADIDLRITVVGPKIFAAEIHSGATNYRVDFRMTMYDADMRPHVLPDAVIADLRALMARLGLVYGAIDMRLTPEGEYVFLEVNPAGQWLFIEERTGQPITEAVAEQLMAAAA